MQFHYFWSFRENITNTLVAFVPFAIWESHLSLHSPCLTFNVWCKYVCYTFIIHIPSQQTQWKMFIPPCVQVSIPDDEDDMRYLSPTSCLWLWVYYFSIIRVVLIIIRGPDGPKVFILFHYHCQYNHYHHRRQWLILLSILNFKSDLMTSFLFCKFKLPNASIVPYRT